MKKSNNKRPMSTMEFLKRIEKLTSSQKKALNNLMDALIKFQSEMKKDDNTVGDKSANF